MRSATHGLARNMQDRIDSNEIPQSRAHSSGHVVGPVYLDRVCISVAGPRIQNELHLSPQDWGLVTGAFAIAYALFETPSEYLVRAPLIRQWDNRAQPGVIEPLLERGEEDGEPDLAGAM